MVIPENEISAFRKKIRRFYREQGRSLPFRETDDPYAITVSEIMLQQTQVERVIPKYNNWLSIFPDWYKLSTSSNKKVLTAWSGLGYNRRALFLKKMAEQVVCTYNGVLPDDVKTLLTFPGIGQYTAHAISAFAFHKKVAAVDTNIRKVLLYTFDLPIDTSDVIIQKIADCILPNRKIRDWHYGLMDYAKTLSATTHRKYGPKQKQSKFEGSLRQIRGEIIRQLTTSDSVTYDVISQSLNRTKREVKQAAESLQSENVIRVYKNKLYLIE